jgi:hypothetical protein
VVDAPRRDLRRGLDRRAAVTGDGATSEALTVLHLVTAAVIVVGFGATLPPRRARSQPATAMAPS